MKHQMKQIHWLMEKIQLCQGFGCKERSPIHSANFSIWLRTGQNNALTSFIMSHSKPALAIPQDPAGGHLHIKIPVPAHLTVNFPQAPVAFVNNLCFAYKGPWAFKWHSPKNSPNPRYFCMKFLLTPRLPRTTVRMGTEQGVSSKLATQKTGKFLSCTSKLRWPLHGKFAVESNKLKQ